MDKAKETAHGPKSKNLESRTNARARCFCDNRTCSTMGNCLGKFQMLSNAVRKMLNADSF
jgi:hypothetical protein